MNTLQHNPQALESRLNSEGGVGRTLFNVAAGTAIVVGGIWLLFHFPHPLNVQNPLAAM